MVRLNRVGAWTCVAILGVAVAASAQPPASLPRVDPVIQSARFKPAPFRNLWLPHSQKTRNHYGLPAWNYDHDMPRAIGFLATTLEVEDEVTQKVWIDGGFASAKVRRKTFRLSSREFQVEWVRLDEFSLAVYDTGDFRFSARLYDEGGREKQLVGHLVTLSLSARAGRPEERIQPLHGRLGGPIDGPEIWNKRKTFWLTARQPEVLSLSGMHGELQRSFDEITGFNVTLQYEKGR